MTSYKLGDILQIDNPKAVGYGARGMIIAVSKHENPVYAITWPFGGCVFYRTANQLGYNIVKVVG